MTSLLFIHIVVAVLTMGASIAGLVQAWRRSESIRATIIALWTSFGATAATGAALVVVSPNALAHTCVMMSAYVVVATGVHLYARQRISIPVER